MANDLYAQAKPLVKATQGDDLRVLAACYEEAMGALPDQVHELQETELGKLAQRLRNAAGETKDLATAADEDCAAPLARMASAAQNAADRLQGKAPRAQRPHSAGGWLSGSPLLCAGGGPGEANGLLTATASRVLLTSVVSATQLSEPADLAPWFHKNRDLIPKLVHAGVFLAGHYGDPNTLERARCCNRLALKLADEMQSAADRQEGGRMAALAQYLGSLLEDGVAVNLASARSQEKFSEKDMQEVGSETDKLLVGLPEQLQKLQDPQLAPSRDTALNAIRAGREKVQKALAR
jgi:hypothetical protein